ncbi:MAG: diguanylate cyclase [Actinobacteria bacterium]|nr:diguanylate cyclase [Actinomycetota bacterium]
MSDQPTVLVADAHESADRIAEEITRDGMTVERVDGLEACLRRLDAGGIDVLLLALDGEPDALTAVRGHPSDLPVVTIAEPGAQQAETAMHAGAEDRITRGELPDSMVPRLLRHAVERHHLRRELRALEIVDEATGLPNLRGFAPIAEHHMRMADRMGAQVVFVFVRVSDAADVVEVAGVLRRAVRDADVPAHVAPDTFCVLLTGNARGAEAAVLSRLIEAIAVTNARPDRETSLSLDVGSSLYDPQHPLPLEDMLTEASRRMSEGSKT